MDMKLVLNCIHNDFKKLLKVLNLTWNLQNRHVVIIVNMMTRLH